MWQVARVSIHQIHNRNDFASPACLIFFVEGRTKVHFPYGTLVCSGSSEETAGTGLCDVGDVADSAHASSILLTCKRNCAADCVHLCLARELQRARSCRCGSVVGDAVSSRKRKGVEKTLNRLVTLLSATTATSLFACFLVRDKAQDRRAWSAQKENLTIIKSMSERCVQQGSGEPALIGESSERKCAHNLSYYGSIQRYRGCHP